MVGFGAVAALAERLASEPGKLKKRAAIAEGILAAQRDASGSGFSDLGFSGSEGAGLFALYLAGTPFAEADPRKLNAGGALLSRAVLKVSGASEAALTAAYRRHGDLGAASFELLSGTEKEAALTLVEVRDAFAGMAAARTTAVRATLVEGLLGRATALEAKYLLKLMLGDMRIGVKQSLVEEAIAVASSAAVTDVRQAVMLEADLAGTVRRAFEGTLGEARMRLFHPLGFMLASPVETPEEAIERFTRKPVKRASGKLLGLPNRKTMWLRWERMRLVRQRVGMVAKARSRRFLRTSMTGCERRCIAAIRRIRGAWRSTRGIKRM